MTDVQMHDMLYLVYDGYILGLNVANLLFKY